MNILDVLLKIILGATNGGNSLSNAAEVTKQILAQLKNVLKSLITLFICSVIFCLLTGYLIDRTLTQIDSGPFVFTNSIIFLLVLIVVNLIVMAWALKRASEKDQPASKEICSGSRNDGSPLETAIAALIFSYIKEREAKINATQEKTTANSAE